MSVSRTLVLTLVLVMVAPSVAMAAQFWEYNPGDYAGSWVFLSDAQKKSYWYMHHAAEAARYEAAAAQVGAGSSASAAVRAYKAGQITLEEAYEVARSSTGGARVSQVAASTQTSVNTVTKSVVSGSGSSIATGLRQWGSRLGISGEAFAASLGPMMLYYEASKSLRGEIRHSDGSPCQEVSWLLCDEGTHWNEFDRRAMKALWEQSFDFTIEESGTVNAPPPPDPYIDITGLYAGSGAPRVTHASGSGALLTDWNKAVVNALLFDASSNIRLLSSPSPTGPTYTDYGAQEVWDCSAVNSLLVYDPSDGLTRTVSSGLFRVGRVKSTGVVWLSSPSGLSTVGSHFVGRELYPPSEVTTYTVPPMVLPDAGPGISIARLTDPVGGWDADPTVDDLARSIDYPDPASIPEPVKDSVEQDHPGEPIVQPSPDTVPDVSVGTTWLEDLFAPLRSLFLEIDIFWPFRFMAGSG